MSIILKKEEVPKWLHNSQLYESMDDDGEFEVPKYNFKKHPKINSLDDFVRVLNTYNYWILNEYPDSIYEYGLDHYHDVLPIVIEFESGKNHLLSDSLSEMYFLKSRNVVSQTDYSYLADEVNFVDGGIIENEKPLETMYKNVEFLLFIRKHIERFFSNLKKFVTTDQIRNLKMSLYKFDSYEKVVYNDLISINKTLESLENKFELFLELNGIDFEDDNLNDEEYEILNGKNVKFKEILIKAEQFIKQFKNSSNPEYDVDLVHYNNEYFDSIV